MENKSLLHRADIVTIVRRRDNGGLCIKIVIVHMMLVMLTWAFDCQNLTTATHVSSNLPEPGR